MSRRGRVLLAAIVALALPALLPAGAGAHAALLKAAPSASAIAKASPAEVSLTYSEAVEPRFAIISVTDKSGNRVTIGPPERSPTNPDELQVPLRKLTSGWYLVYWRVISVDGHPVRGAYTFAVGPTPGVAPQFVVPSLSETAATPGLLIARWIVLLSLLACVGLLAFRLAIARPLLRRVPDTSLRAVSIGLAVALAVAVVSTLVYVDIATAEFAQLSTLDLGKLVPLMRASAFGRSYLDLALVLALAAIAALAAVRLDDPHREVRSVAQILANLGALAGAGAALLVPGLAGHAGQYSPRGLSLALDWLHLATGGLWVGGLLGLTLVAAATHSGRRVACMVVVVPRFSRVALFSVLGLIASGTVASLIRLPTLSSLWQTGYGQALLVKIGLLLVALMIAAVNLLRTTPRLEASERKPGLGEPTTRILRRLVGGEVFLVVGAVFAAGVMSSLAPPPQSLADVGSPAAKVGPGPVVKTIKHGVYTVQFGVTPNRGATFNAFTVRVLKDGKPLPGATVTAKFTQLDMDMGQQIYKLKEHSPAVYSQPRLPSLVMVGDWGLDFTITPPGDKPFSLLLIDKARG
jgi:copper transport protein